MREAPELGGERLDGDTPSPSLPASLTERLRPELPESRAAPASLVDRRRLIFKTGQPQRVDNAKSEERRAFLSPSSTMEVWPHSHL